MNRNSFIFYASFWEAIKLVPREVQGEVLTAIIEYGLTGATTEPLKPIAEAMFTLIKPQLEANHQRFINGQKGGKHGKLGGRPKNKNPDKTPIKPLNNPNKTPNVNDNVNDNVNVNDDDDDDVNVNRFSKININDFPELFKQDQIHYEQLQMNYKGLNIDACLVDFLTDRKKQGRLIDTYESIRGHLFNWVKLKVG